MTTDQIEWKKLIRSVLKGDPSASSELIRISHKPLFVYCLHLTKNKQSAEDLTHDALLKALAALSTLKEPNAFMGWLKTIARLQYLDFVKSAAQSKVHVAHEDLENESSYAVDPAVSPEKIHAMRVLQQLAEEDRSILILIDIQECSYAEASQVIGIPEGTVKSRLFRAREKFSVLYKGTIETPRSSQVTRNVAKGGRA